MPQEPIETNDRVPDESDSRIESDKQDLKHRRGKLRKGWEDVSAAGQTGVSHAYALLRKSVAASEALAASTGKVILDHVSRAEKAARGAREKTLSDAAIWLNAILASDFSVNIDRWLGKTFNEGVPSVYDKAVDAVYNATHVGGGHLHRLFDDSHTVWGMWDKVRDARPDDSFLQEVVGYASALGKDLASPVGIPILGLSKASYDQVAGTLSSTFHIPKSWFADMLHVNATEVVGCTIATISVALKWNKAKTQEFAELAAGLGISSLAAANPALAVVSLVTLGKSVVSVNKEGAGKTEIVNGLVRGGVGTGAFLASASIVGGPAWIGLLSGVCVAAIAHRAVEHFDVAEVGGFITARMREAAGQFSALSSS